MQVDSWQLTIYQARTSLIRDVLTSDTRASRLSKLDFELRASPFGPTCWGLNFAAVRGPDIAPVSAALLDTVSLTLNGTVVYTGRISKLPGYGGLEDSFEVQGHYRLAKTVFQAVPIAAYTGQFWPKVLSVLETKLGVGNALVPTDPTVTVSNWTVEDTNVKLDSLCRMFSDLLGGGLAYGFRADGKFVIGPRPLTPLRTLGLGTFESREAQLANRLYVTTGYEKRPQMVFEEAASLNRDGPLEETEDLSGLVKRGALGLSEIYNGEILLFLKFQNGTYLSLRSTNDTIASRVATTSEADAAAGLGNASESISGTSITYDYPVRTNTSTGGPPTYYTSTQRTVSYSYSAVTGAGPVTQARLLLGRGGNLEIYKVASSGWLTRAAAAALTPVAAGVLSGSISIPPGLFVGSTSINFTIAPPKLRDPAAADVSTLTGLDITRYTAIGLVPGHSTATVVPYIPTAPINPGEKIFELTWSWPGGANEFLNLIGTDTNMALSGLLIDELGGGSPLTSYLANRTGVVTMPGGVNVITWDAAEGTQTELFFQGFNVFTMTALTGSNLKNPIAPVIPTTTIIDFSALRGAADNLFLEKYGPTLRGTVTLPNQFEPPGGRGRYRYGDGEETILIDYSGRYTLDGGAFQTVMQGGSKSRYNAAQSSRVGLDELNRRISKAGL